MIELRGLIVDWGGVLTSSLADCMGAWAEKEDLDPTGVAQVMRALVFGADGELLPDNPIHALERGEVQAPYLEARLSARLRTRGGDRLPPDGLIERMFAHFVLAPEMAGLVLRARRAGVRTALLSNSWGNDYPREGWEEMFDVVVISGEVGMRKPDAEILTYTAYSLGLIPDDCVLLDDDHDNVAAARALGMVGVRHESYFPSAQAISDLFGIPIADRRREPIGPSDRALRGEQQHQTGHRVSDHEQQQW